MLVADGAIDLVTDRVWRAGVEAYSQGTWNPLTIADEFADEYLGSLYGGSEDDVIGNKPIWGALGELAGGRPVNIGTGFIPNSDLSAAAQERVEATESDIGAYASAQYQSYAQDAKAWNENAMYATPYSQSLAYEAARQGQLQSEVINAPGQADLGKPLTQAYDLKAESYIQPIRFGLPDFDLGPIRFRSPAPLEDGRQHLDRISGGRILSAYVAEPGTAPANWVSGGFDFAKQIGLDPLNIVGGAVAKPFKGARAIGMTDAGVQAARNIGVTEDVVTAVRNAPSAFSREAVMALKDNIGGGLNLTPQRLGETIDQIRRAETVEEALVITNRARTTIDPKKANHYLTGGQAQPVVEALARTTKMKEVDAILSNVKGRIPASLRRQLVEATNETEVIETLLPYLDSGLRLQGNLSTWGEIAAAGSISEFVLGQGLMAAPSRIYRGVLSSPYAVIDRTVEAGLDSLHRLRMGGAPIPGGVASPIGDLSMRARMRYRYGNTWAGRMVNDQSNKGVDPSDIDLAYDQVANLARNGGLDIDDIWVRTSKGRVIAVKSMDDVILNKGEKVAETIDLDNVFRELASTAPGDAAGVANVMKRVMDAVGLSLRADGVNDQFIRQITRLWEESQADSLYFVNAVGEVVEYPGSGFAALLDGEMAMMPGGQLLNEFHHGVINVPDPSVLRRTLAEGNKWGRTLNRVTTQKGGRIPKLSDIEGIGDLRPRNWDDGGANLAERAALRYARSFMSNVWKPAKLLRLGYPLKIILGDEQARMAAIGLSNFWTPWRGGDSPLAYLSILLADRPLVGRWLKNPKTDVMGDPLRLASEYQNTVRLRDNSFGEIGAMRSDSWKIVEQGSDEYLDGLATEVAQLIDDPLVGRLFDAELGGIDNLKAWLLSGDPDAVQLLDTYVRAIRRSNPIVAEDFARGGKAMDNYLAGIEARAHLKTGGDYAVVDPNTGDVLDGAGQIIGRAGEGQFAGFTEGFRITRPGSPVLLEAMNTKRVGDVRVSGMNTAAYSELRKVVRMHLDEASELFPQAVKYSVGHGPSANNPGVAKQIVDRLMDWVVSKPAENLSRSPTFTQLYWRQIGSYLPDMTDDAAEQILRRAKEAGMDTTVRSAAREAGKGTKSMGVDELESIDMYAKSFAAEGTIDLLFDFANRKQVFDALNLIFPFGDAFLEAFTSYGRIFASDPTLARRPLKAIEELRGNNPLEWGEDEFQPDEGFFHVNEFGEEVFSLPLTITGPANTSMGFDIPLGSLNMIANQFYPGIGPVVTIPAASAIPDDPAWQGVKDLIAPFGMEDSTPAEFLDQTFGGSPTVNRFLLALTEGRFLGGQNERVFNQTVGWITRDMLSSGEYTVEDLANPDMREQIFAEARSRAQWVYVTRGLLQATLPASPTAPTMFGTISEDDPAKFQKLALQDASQAFYDIFNNEAENDWEVAQATFLERYGFDSVPYLVSFYEENAKSGVTYEAWKSERRFPEVYDNLPRTAYYLQPDDPEDPFYYRAWTEQFGGDRRELKTQEEWADDYVYRVAASRYSRLTEEAAGKVASGEFVPPTGIEADEYLDIINDTIKTNLIKELPGYRESVNLFSPKEMQEQISELREWGTYDRLANNPTAKAVNEFFTEAWDPAYNALVDAGYGSSRSQVLPFRRVSVVRIKSDGSISDSWATRAAVAEKLIEQGDRIAQRPGNGNFDIVWNEVIKPSIYDYRTEVPGQPNEQEDRIEMLVASLMEG